MHWKSATYAKHIYTTPPGTFSHLHQGQSHNSLEIDHICYAKHIQTQKRPLVQVLWVLGAGPYPFRRRWCLFVAQVESLLGAGVVFGANPSGSWRRSIPFPAQVVPLRGAGEVFGGEPAPLQGTEKRFAAQVPTLFPYLRPKPPTPAPPIHPANRLNPPAFRKGGGFHNNKRNTINS